MATPNFNVSGIARDLGPVGGDLSDLIAGKFDPTKYFNMVSGDAGKLLGAISVAEIIKAIDPDETASNAQAPQISDKLIYRATTTRSRPPLSRSRSTGSRRCRRTRSVTSSLKPTRP